MPRTGTVFIAGMALAAVLAGCSHPRYYAEAEYGATTNGPFAAQGHFAVYYPAEIALDFPGYVVGIELGQRSSLLHDGDLVVEHFVHAGDTMTRLTDTLRDGQPREESALRTEVVTMREKMREHLLSEAAEENGKGAWQSPRLINGMITQVNMR